MSCIVAIIGLVKGSKEGHSHNFNFRTLKEQVVSQEVKNLIFMRSAQPLMTCIGGKCVQGLHFVESMDLS